MIDLPFFVAFALILSPAFSGSSAHWPSSAAVKSSFGAGGQSGLAQDGPAAEATTLAVSSPNSEKNSRQFGSTASGLEAYCAYNFSTYSALCPCKNEEACSWSFVSFSVIYIT